MKTDIVATLVDSNVLIDVLTHDPKWGDWSASALAEAADVGPLVINPIIYAEVSVGYSRIEELDADLPRDEYRRAQIPWAAGFLAGKCHDIYRRRGGNRRSPLPDFFIGAHAAIQGFRLLTRDAARYRSYFPRLELIAPD